MDIKELLTLHEGLELKAYKCTAGKITIGVGRNVEELGITHDEAMYLLSNDIQRVVDELLANVDCYNSLSDVRKSVLIDMCFNLGISRFLQFKNFLAAVERGDWTDAAREMLDSRWATQVGQRSVRLSEMMISDEWPAA